MQNIKQCVSEANQSLQQLLHHLMEWQKNKAPSAEKIMEWVKQQEYLFGDAEQKTNNLKACLMAQFSNGQDLSHAIANLENELQKNPELNATWQTYQKYLTDCLAYNQQNSAQVSRTLPFVHHLLHLFLGHEQEVIVYNAKGKKTSQEIYRTS